MGKLAGDSGSSRSMLMVLQLTLDIVSGLVDRMAVQPAESAEDRSMIVKLGMRGCSSMFERYLLSSQPYQSRVTSLKVHHRSVCILTDRNEAMSLGVPFVQVRMPRSLHAREMAQYDSSFTSAKALDRTGAGIFLLIGQCRFMRN